MCVVSSVTCGSLTARDCPRCMLDDRPTISLLCCNNYCSNRGVEQLRMCVCVGGGGGGSIEIGCCNNLSLAGMHSGTI